MSTNVIENIKIVTIVLAIITIVFTLSVVFILKL